MPAPMRDPNFDQPIFQWDDFLTDTVEWVCELEE